MIDIIMTSINILSVRIGVFAPIYSLYTLKKNKSEGGKNRDPKPLRRKVKRRSYKLRNNTPVVLHRKNLYCRTTPITIKLEKGNMSKIKVDDTTMEISIPDRDEIISVLKKYNKKDSN